MTPEQIEAEIATLRRELENQKKRGLQWGRVSYVVALLLFVVIGIRMVRTGEDPPTPMMFLGLTFLFLGSAFTTVYQPFRHRWRRQAPENSTAA